jgi:hypothetical protein
MTEREAASAQFYKTVCEWIQIMLACQLPLTSWKLSEFVLACAACMVL